MFCRSRNKSKSHLLKAVMVSGCLEPRENFFLSLCYFMAVELHNIHKISLLFHINTIVCGKRGYSLINICSLDLEASVCVCVCVHTFCLTGLIVYLILQCISIVSDPASLCLFRWLESVMSVFLMAVMAFGLQSCSCFNPILFCHFLCAFSVNCLNR